jgi:DNA repair exonuclease SbcCD ATPase subunit
MAQQRRSRAARRERERAQQQMARELERLARAEEGGLPQRPIAIDSPAVVELRAVARPCPLCGGPLRLESHTAEVIDGTRLRIAQVVCTSCGRPRAIHFRLDAPPVH